MHFLLLRSSILIKLGVSIYDARLTHVEQVRVLRTCPDKAAPQGGATAGQKA